MPSEVSVDMRRVGRVEKGQEIFVQPPAKCTE